MSPNHQSVSQYTIPTGVCQARNCISCPFLLPSCRRKNGVLRSAGRRASRLPQLRQHRQQHQWRISGRYQCRGCGPRDSSGSCRRVRGTSMPIVVAYAAAGQHVNDLTVASRGYAGRWRTPRAGSVSGYGPCRPATAVRTWASPAPPLKCGTTGRIDSVKIQRHLRPSLFAILPYALGDGLARWA